MKLLRRLALALDLALATLTTCAPAFAYSPGVPDTPADLAAVTGNVTFGYRFN